ncbi:AMSH-like ubiquitin thioesterase 1-like protein [Drosera capensis]
MRPPPSSLSSPSPSPPSSINIAAITRKLEVDNRLSLRTYCRIADNILRQADIFRYEKNMIDLYIMLLRFSSLVTETIPRHRDYRTYSQTKTSSLKKQLISALNELEELKPVVELKIAELDRKYSYQANGWNRQKSNFSVTTSIDSSRSTVQTLTNNQLLKLSSNVARDGSYDFFNSQQLVHRTPLENQFQRLSLQIPRPKEETLSKHSILGPSGLRTQWNPRIRNQEVRYPDNIFGSPVDTFRFSLAINETPALRDAPTSLEGPKSSLAPTIQQDHGNLENQRMGLDSDCSHRSISSEPAPMITFETLETFPDNMEACPDIIRQPSPLPILAEVQNLVTEVPSQVTELQDFKDHSLHLSSPESPMDLHISTSMMDAFMRLAKSNTAKNLETCGILAGSLKNRVFYITALIIPKQESTANSCQATNEEEIFEAQDKRSLFQLGWIHTHPTQSCFMSSIDLHTHYSYQVMLPEAVAIVMAPQDSCKKHGIFRLTTPGGMSVIRQCEDRGFHPHDPPADGGPLYKQCTDVYMNPGLKFDIIDLR